MDHFEGSTHVRHRDIEIKCRILDGFIVEQAVDDVVAMKFGDQYRNGGLNSCFALIVYKILYIIIILCTI